MPELPQSYLNRMEKLLGEEYQAFLAAFNVPADAGLRVNTLKISSEDFRARSPFHLETLPWTPAGFRILESNSPPGLHPYHAAGLYYLQEPSAQAVAEILDPQPGERVLDLAAAPGGKTTHIAAKMQNQGLLLANEIHPKRVWDLTKNLERWGARNVVIANESPERLAARLPKFFDRVLVDAPCSGEGMFRKMPEAVRDWSPEFVQGCSLRQRAILDAAGLLVRPGGYLCYATCTFSPEENERVIAHFLETHPSYELVTPAWKPGFQPALPGTFEGSETPVRLWPHKSPGEGHFIALLRRMPSPNFQSRSAQNSLPASRALPRLAPFWERFSQQVLNGFEGIQNLQVIKSYLYSFPAGTPDLRGLKLIRPGWWLGSFKKDRFEPSHALAMALTPAEALQTVSLDQESAGVYLRREIFHSPGQDGWTLVTLQGYPLGWGKRVRGQMKNHYPKGLRRMS